MSNKTLRPALTPKSLPRSKLKSKTWTGTGGQDETVLSSSSGCFGRERFLCTRAGASSLACKWIEEGHACENAVVNLIPLCSIHDSVR
jgi:hypothetical protein